MAVHEIIGGHVIGLLSVSSFDAQLVVACRALDDDGRARLRARSEELRAYLSTKTAFALLSSHELTLLACLVPGAMRGLPDPASCLDPKRGGFSPKRMEQSAGWLSRVVRLLQVARWLTDDRLRHLSIEGTVVSANALRSMPDDRLIEWLTALGQSPVQGQSAAASYEDLSADDAQSDRRLRL